MNHRWDQLQWLANDDVTNERLLERIPLLDYFMKLDRKIKDAKKQMKK